MNSEQILIVEDEVVIAEFIASVLASVGHRKVTVANREEEALRYMTNINFDLALLDIRMEREESGLYLAQALRKKHAEIPFIFITAQSDPVIMSQAIKIKPRSYLTKPIKKSDLIAAVELALSDRKPQQKVLQFKDGWNTIQLPQNDLIYLEASGNYVQVVSTRQKYLVRYTLAWFRDQLPEPPFIQTHRSYLVNFDKVAKVETKKIHINGQELPLSKNGHKKVKPLINS